MRIRSKICGISTLEALDAAVAGGATWVGLVCFPRSPRHVAPEQARQLIHRLPDHVTAVAVLVDPNEAIVEQMTEAGVRAVQLHGSELPERLAAMRRPGVELWKAVPIRARADLDQVGRYRGVADRIVYDAKTPSGTLPGGMGLRFDWHLLDGFVHPRPWLLSGGLTAEMLEEATGITAACAVDVSSGVESAPGVKDVDKIAAFLQAAARI